MDLHAIRKRLEERLDVLTGRLAVIDRELRTPGASDSQDRATESENQEVLERLSVAERRELEDIRIALGRLRDGRYAVCSVCGEPIPTARLEALPYTHQCVRCAASG